MVVIFSKLYPRCIYYRLIMSYAGTPLRRRTAMNSKSKSSVMGEILMSELDKNISKSRSKLFDLRTGLEKQKITRKDMDILLQGNLLDEIHNILQVTFLKVRKETFSIFSIRDSRIPDTCRPKIRKTVDSFCNEVLKRSPDLYRDARKASYREIDREIRKYKRARTVFVLSLAASGVVNAIKTFNKSGKS
jgi:hypothetical protein